jgi:outer membrane cobalamin receptor
MPCVSPRLPRLLVIVLAAVSLAWARPALAAAPPVTAHPGTASLSGSVTDPAGEAVALARVILKSGRGIAAEATSDASGHFEIASVPPGRYELLTVREGFRADPRVVEIKAGESEVVTIPLRLAAIAESLVVSASQVEMPLSRVPGSVSVLDQRDLRLRQLRSVADVLRLVPGMTVAQTGGTGAVTSVFPRGGESDYSLVLVDGIRQNSFGGGFDFAHLALFDVASVEVVRGPQSAQYGADAIGGVIHVRSKIGGQPSVAGLSEVGSRGSSRLAAATSGGAGAFGWGAGVERVASAGFNGLSTAAGERIENDGYRAVSTSLGAAWKPDSRSSLRASLQFGTNRRGYPGPFGSNPIGAFPGIDRISRGKNDTGLASLSFDRNWSPGTGMSVQATFGDLRSVFASPYGDSTSRTRRASLRVQVDHALSAALSGSAGVEAMSERADSSAITGLDGPLPIKRQVVGYFAEGRYQGHARWFVTAGLRVEQIRREALSADPLGWTPRPALPAANVVSPNPRVAASYYLRTSDASGGNWTRVHASAGTGIRAPDAFEIAFTDNANLKPERSRSADAGIEQALAGGRVVVDVTGFANRYEDLIVAVGRALADYSQFRTDNIANARSSGVEFSGAVRTAWGLDARFAYTYLDTAVLAVDRSNGLAPAPFSVGDPLIRRPRHQASVDALFARNRFTAFLRIGGRSRVLDVEPNYGASGGLFHSAGFAVADAGAGWRMTRVVELLARVENLLDRRYEHAFGYPAPGRTLTVGVRLAASR